MEIKYYIDKENKIGRCKLPVAFEKPIIAIKILPRKYAILLANSGITHFSNPRSWSNNEKFSKLQLDSTEGIFCSSKNYEDGIKLYHKHFEAKLINGYYKFYDTSPDIFCTCFYCIYRSDFKKINDGTLTCVCSKDFLKVSIVQLMKRIINKYPMTNNPLWL